MLIILRHLHTANMPKESTAPFPMPGGWSWDTPSSFQLLRILSDSWLQFPRGPRVIVVDFKIPESLDFNIEDSSDSCCWWMFIPKNDGRKLWRWRWWSLKPASSFSYGSKSVTPPVLRSENMKIGKIDRFLQIDWFHTPTPIFEPWPWLLTLLLSLSWRLPSGRALTVKPVVFDSGLGELNIDSISNSFEIKLEYPHGCV